MQLWVSNVIMIIINFNFKVIGMVKVAQESDHSTDFLIDLFILRFFFHYNFN